MARKPLPKVDTFRTWVNVAVIADRLVAKIDFDLEPLSDHMSLEVMRQVQDQLGEKIRESARRVQQYNKIELKEKEDG